MILCFEYTLSSLFYIYFHLPWKSAGYWITYYNDERHAVYGQLDKWFLVPIHTEHNHPFRVTLQCSQTTGNVCSVFYPLRVCKKKSVKWNYSFYTTVFWILYWAILTQPVSRQIPQSQVNFIELIPNPHTWEVVEAYKLGCFHPPSHFLALFELIWPLGSIDTMSQSWKLILYTTVSHPSSGLLSIDIKKQCVRQNHFAWLCHTEGEDAWHRVSECDYVHLI